MEKIKKVMFGIFTIILFTLPIPSICLAIEFIFAALSFDGVSAFYGWLIGTLLAANGVIDCVLDCMILKELKENGNN